MIADSPPMSRMSAPAASSSPARSTLRVERRVATAVTEGVRCCVDDAHQPGAGAHLEHPIDGADAIGGVHRFERMNRARPPPAPLPPALRPSRACLRHDLRHGHIGDDPLCLGLFGEPAYLEHAPLGAPAQLPREDLPHALDGTVLAGARAARCEQPQAGAAKEHVADAARLLATSGQRDLGQYVR